ncbi:MAG: BamA/TamA family outer membrane protein [Alphaproteobacteria bacterium]|nr:BamA/TamA family outer membrane protein [Alphaproteobacteria bacterium]
MQGDSQNKILTNELSSYWDDSLKVVRERFLLFFNPIKNTIKFDSSYFLNTKKVMKNYLNAHGYFEASLSDSFSITNYKKEKRVTTYIKIKLGVPTRISSIRYSFKDSSLNNLIQKNSYYSKLKIQNIFDNQLILNEIDRLYILLLNNGYAKFQRENIFVEVDTLSSDIDTSSKKKEAKLNFLLSPFTNNEQTKIFFIRNQYYYPDLLPTQFLDTFLPYSSWPNQKTNKNFYLRSTSNLFKLSIFKTQSLMAFGRLYKDSAFKTTVSNLNLLNCWRQINPKFIFDGDSLDFHFFMSAIKPKSWILDLELSNNTGTSIDPSTANLLGVGTNITYKNKNFLKRAYTTNLNFKIGTEINIKSNTAGFLVSQTFNTLLGFNILIPRFILPFSINPNLNLLNKKTFINLSLGYTDRYSYFTSQVISANFGYEWRYQKPKNQFLFVYRPLNFEIYQINKRDSFLQLLAANPFLLASFNQGNVIGQNFTMIINFKKSTENVSQTLRFNVEESGLLLNLFKNTNSIYKFIKIDADFRIIKLLPKGELAYRLIGGYGYNFNSQFFTLPFFKQYTSGGVNSMRGWVVRQLGLGSSITQDTVGLNSYRDRFGDIQFETNLEYRFKMFKFGSVEFNSCLFVDIGNIWNLKSAANDKNSVFNISRLFQDLAIAVGTGLRIDLANYLIIRLDFGFKLKDPTRTYNNGWIDISNFKWNETKYNSGGSFKIDNFAFQLGIGLPF